MPAKRGPLVVKDRQKTIFIKVDPDHLLLVDVFLACFEAPWTVGKWVIT